MAKQKKKEVLLSPLPKEMTKKRLQKLLYMFCVHVIEYETAIRLTSDVDCDACILRDIPWVQNIQAGDKIEHCTKDLCYAIWHAGVLKVKS